MDSSHNSGHHITGDAFLYLRSGRSLLYRSGSGLCGGCLLESNGLVQMGVQDNNVFYQGYANYLGVVPEGMVLGVSTSETADGMPGITFVAAVKYDLYNETLSLTMLDGQNPFAEGKTQLQLTRCPDP